MLLSITWPAFTLFIALRLLTAAEATDLTRGLGNNLTHVAGILWILDFTRQLVRVDGLAEAHFSWSERVRRRIRVWTRRLTLVGLPFVVVVALLNAHITPTGTDAWERVAFVLVQLLLAVALPAETCCIRSRAC
ncbi:MAG: hypothetical protein R3B90_02200 [Planctomycetaceae bacterium]